MDYRTPNNVHHRRAECQPTTQGPPGARARTTSAGPRNLGAVKRYSTEVDTAIAALLGQRVPPAEILERLNAGTAADGLPAIRPPMPRRTFFDHVRRVRTAHPDLEHTITAENELERAGALRRRLLDLCEREYEKLAARAAGRKPLTSAEASTLARLSKTVDDIETRARRRDELRGSKNPAHRGSAAAADTPREKVIAALQRATAAGDHEPASTRGYGRSGPCRETIQP